jgi:MoaA/NifB/PqqE/SkfB family radical SAM enzyme
MQLLSIKPKNDLFYITWNIGIRCNFDCSYCPPKLHDKISKHKSLEELKNAWERIIKNTSHTNKKYQIIFTGGEPTLNPNFLPFIKWLKENYNEQIFEIHISTNGTANNEIYKNLIFLVNGITFSSHFEFANFDKLWKNIIKTHIFSVKLKKITFVNIMDEFKYQTEAKKLQELCDKYKVPYFVVRIEENMYDGR